MVNRLNGMAPVPAVVREEVSAVELAYQQLEKHLEKTSNSNWETGQLFERLHEMGETDESIGQRAGLSRESVNKIRNTCLTFGTGITNVKKNSVLSFKHYSTALGWDDADEWLDFANKNKLSVREMVAERDASNYSEPLNSSVESEHAEPVTDAELVEYEDVEPPDAEAVDEAFAEPEESLSGSEESQAEVLTADPVDLAIANAIAVKQIRSKLNELVKMIEGVEHPPKPGMEKIAKARRTILRALDQVKSSISCSIPDCRCTRCGGARCNYCDQLGWIDAHTKKNWLENR